MDQGLDSAWSKFRRGEEHLESLKQLVLDWAKVKPYRFVTEEDVISTVERVVTRVAKEVVPERPILHEPFPRLTYADAMARYGSDKPDIRFGMELVDLTDTLRGVDFRVFA